MQTRLSDEQISSAFQRALQQSGLIDQDDTAVIFYDLSFLDERVADLKRLFPADTLHAIAVKANPLHRILKRIQPFGVGLEAATLPEICIAIDAGFAPEKIVFDSPAKTKAEIKEALRLGVHLNADSLMELDRIGELLQSMDSKSTVAVRVNPQVGEGAYSATSTAGEYSKFGVPLKQFRAELKDRYRKCDWLTGIHVHIGSQTMEVEQLIEGARLVVSLVREINGELRETGKPNKINIFDLGGGLPASYKPDENRGDMSVYCAKLKENFPELFNGEFRLITEFGRYIHASTGWVASKVEYVKRDFKVFEEKINTAMIHVGADMFLRKCYNPGNWHHEIMVVDDTGKIKPGVDGNPYNIAGPLCFSGDLIARNISLPRIEESDFVVVQDVGAYTLSMWSRYNTRQIPKVIGYQRDGEEFEVLKKRESIEQALSFWV